MAEPSPVAKDTDSESYFSYVIQSEELEVTHFVDENSGLTVGVVPNLPSLGDATNDTEITKFLSRPVKIGSFTWTEADPVGIKSVLTPWSLWATNPYVKNKLNNYAFLRGNLHVKIVINASPFYYGLTQVSYLPRQNDKPSTIVNDAGTRYLIPYSQRPRLFLDPQSGEAGEMILPFIFSGNMIKTAQLQSFTDMGQLHYMIYAMLRSANGVPAAGISVVTYAWLTEVELSGATVAYAAQSEIYEAQSDEYGEGCISRPASYVAKAASYFERIPVIGVFATATRIGASAVSAIASLFGFTNVPVIADTVPQRPEAFPKLASSEIGFPVEKLTLDPKNELSVDPRIVGMADGSDDMMICSLTSRESYLTTLLWSTSAATDDLLFYSRINPKLYDNDGATDAKLYMTPMCYAANLFNNWRGDIIFKFRVVASQFHKGRLRISYDPSAYTGQDLSSIVESSNIVQTAIIDIGEVNEVEFRVPYQQGFQFLYNRNLLGAANKGWAANTAFGAYPLDGNYDNGVITVRVLNILTAPVASSDINILVSVRGAENLEFANPTTVIAEGVVISPYEPQSEIYSEKTEELSMTLGSVCADPDNQYAIYFGENIRSFRQLLRRYEYHSTKAFKKANVAYPALHLQVLDFNPMPVSPGYLNIGPERANAIVGAGVFAYNYCHYTMLSYLSNAYLMYRGSINWTYNMIEQQGTLASEIRVSKNNLHTTPYAYATSTYNASAQSAVSANMISIQNAGTTGQAITNCNTNTGMNVACPMFSGHKYHYTVPRNANQGVIEDGSIQDGLSLYATYLTPASAGDSQSHLKTYVGIGTDFSFHYFVNVPTLFIYSVVPTPA